MKAIKNNIYLLLILAAISCDEPVVTPEPEPEIEDTYAACISDLSASTLDIATWNIQKFSESNTNYSELKKIIKAIDADIIGVQEIVSTADFDDFVNTIPGWEGAIIGQGNLNVGYLYKTEEITLDSELSTIYADNSSAFPRAPVLGTFAHVSGYQFTLINLHLKCCGGSTNENRRKAASDLLKLYIDDNLSEDNVMIIGDFNDEIDEPADFNVFQNFIDDEANFRFVDMEIAQGSERNFSYPSWPSHIDHILITNEIFNNWQSTSTLIIDDCFSKYESQISDHRPVLARFKTN